jgi:hypothetical protein
MPGQFKGGQVTDFQRDALDTHWVDKEARMPAAAVHAMAVAMKGKYEDAHRWVDNIWRRRVRLHRKTRKRQQQRCRTMQLPHLGVLLRQSRLPVCEWLRGRTSTFVRWQRW